MIDDLAERLAEFSADPLGYVLFAYTWGESGPLAEWNGPQDWQAEILDDLGKGIINVHEAIARSEDTVPVRFARGSGHGIGKSALVSWILDWGQSTFPEARGIVTANTELQLRTKTWVEFRKWHNLSLSNHLFDMTATSRRAKDPRYADTWRVDMIPWNEKNPQAFAGLHNKGKRLVLLFDEASEIHDTIWDTAEGALTDQDTEIVWAAFGNPSKSTGRFVEILPGGKYSHRWNSKSIDSRTSSITNKTQIDEWIADRGIDSDFVRIRILGLPPKTDEDTFFPAHLVERALEREIFEKDIDPDEPLVMGVDVGRKNDPTAIVFRRGYDARSIPPILIFGEEENFGPTLAMRLFNLANYHNVDMMFVDTGGLGYSVCDSLTHIGANFVPIDFGSGATGTNLYEPQIKYANKRAEMYGAGRYWMKFGALFRDVPSNDRTTKEEFIGPKELFKDDKIQVETKKEMKGRGMPSPNLVDAFVLTFALPVPRRDLFMIQKPTEVEDWNPFSKENVYGHGQNPEGGNPASARIYTYPRGLYCNLPRGHRAEGSNRHQLLYPHLTARRSGEGVWQA